MTCPSAAGNRNLLLAVHFGEADPGRATAIRAHVSHCASCREYLASLDQVGRALLAWEDEAPPAGMAQGVMARAASTAQARTRRPGTRRADALPLAALVPVMVALMALIRRLAAWLPTVSYWPRLDAWPVLEPALPFVVATLALAALGGLAALAAAPALMLEARRQET